LYLNNGRYAAFQRFRLIQKGNFTAEIAEVAEIFICLLRVLSALRGEYFHAFSEHMKHKMQQRQDGKNHQETHAAMQEVS
jgi:hypothetical protein